MNLNPRSFLLSILIAAIAGGAGAIELAGRVPFQGGAFGQQSDAGTGTGYIQSFVPPEDAVVEAIRWWGFHGSNSAGSTFDNFVVKLGGIVQSGTLTVVSITTDIQEYTLDVTDAALTALSLEILNDSLDVEWFWQSAEAIGSPGAPDANEVAFSILGRVEVTRLSEPLTALMLGLGTLLALATRRSTLRLSVD